MFSILCRTNETQNISNVSYYDNYRLKKCAIYKKFKNIDIHNNKLIVTINAGATTTITITPGNYDQNELLTEVETKLKTIDPNFTMVYNTIDYTYTITNLTLFKIEKNFTTINEVLGLTNDLLNTFTLSLKTNMINLMGCKVYYLHHTKDGIYKANVSGGIKSNVVLSFLPMDINQDVIKIEFDNYLPRFNINDNTISEFYITCDNSNIRLPTCDIFIEYVN